MKPLDEMKPGLVFWSQSKIQKEPIEYIYKGKLANGLHCLIAVDGDPEKACQVFPEWFENRDITIGGNQ